MSIFSKVKIKFVFEKHNVGDSLNNIIRGN